MLHTISLAALLGSPNVDLTWVAPVGCPDETAGRERLERYLGDVESEVGAAVEIRPSSEGYRATITIEGDSTPRELTSTDCAALGEAAALVIAVAIDPVQVAEALGEAAEPATDQAVSVPPLESSPVDSQPEQDVTSDRVAQSVPVPSPPRRRTETPTLAHWLRIAGGVGYEVVPAVTGVFELGYVLGVRRWRFEASARYVPPRALEYDDPSGVGGRFQVLTFGARACPTPGVAKASFPLCFGFEGGPAFGRGVGVVDTQTPVSGWLAAEAGVAAVVELHRTVALFVGGDVLVSLVRPAFHVGDRGRLFRAPLVGGRGLVGIEVRLN